MTFIMTEASPSPSFHTLKELEFELESLRKENFDFKLRVFHLEERLARLQGTSLQEASESVNVYLQLEEAENELRSKDDLLHRAREALDNLQKQKSSLAEQLEIQQQNHTNEVNKLNQELKSLQKQHELLKATADQEEQNHTNEIYTLKQQLKSLQKQHELLKSEVEQEDQTHTTEVISLKKQLKAVQKQYELFKSEINLEQQQHHNQTTSLTREIEHYKAREEELRAQTDGLKLEIQSLQSQLDLVNSSSSSRSSEINELRRKNLQLEDHNKLLYMEIEDRGNKIQILTAEIKHRKKELVQVRTQLNSAIERLKPLESVRTNASISPKIRKIPVPEVCDHIATLEREVEDDWAARLDSSLSKLNATRNASMSFL
ncbi:hypothetical protein RCL1_003123 [Eukaryota sp. TZLM3-RCL]